MRHPVAMALVLTSLLMAQAADAGPKGDKGKDKHDSHSEGFNCPPGLARKNPPCIPPGQVRPRDILIQPQVQIIQPDIVLRNAPDLRPYQVGHGLPEGYVLFFDPQLYPYWPGAIYVRYGDFLYVINRRTGEVMQSPGPVSDWTWRWSDVDFGHCPPGLARKNPPCVPPGQIGRRLIDPYQPGDQLPNGYTVILTPPVQQGPDRSVYARYGDSLYRVDRQNGQVLQWIGDLSALLR